MIFLCTCGYESTNESHAMRHAFVYHAKAEERNDVELFKRRVRTMIYSAPWSREFSFDEM
jgi:hypothetical protein